MQKKPKTIIDLFCVTFTDSCSTLLSVSIFDLELHNCIQSRDTAALVHVRLSITHYPHLFLIWNYIALYNYTQFWLQIYGHNMDMNQIVMLNNMIHDMKF